MFPHFILHMAPKQQLNLDNVISNLFNQSLDLSAIIDHKSCSSLNLQIFFLQFAANSIIMEKKPVLKCTAEFAVEQLFMGCFHIPSIVRFGHTRYFLKGLAYQGNELSLSCDIFLEGPRPV